MTNYNKKKTEDILSDDILIERLTKDDLPPGQFTEEDAELAHQIVNSLCENKTGFADEAKELLDKRILDSIRRHKRKKMLVASGMAAGFLILIGLTFLLRTLGESEISKFAATISIKPGYEYTKLILADKKEVQISSEESKIKYSENGSEVKIDTLQKVNQQIGASAPTFNTLVVPYGKRSQITLSDSSVVWINSGSKLVYPARFAKGKREVYLEGEALFSVRHDENHPFYVMTPHLDVKVLGTVFNVSAYSDDPTVQTVLERGSVELRYNNRLIFVPSVEKMVPGRLAVYDPAKNTLQQSSVNTRNYTSWKDGYFIFESCTFGDIVKKISRYYNVPIELGDPTLAGGTFSGRLNLRNSLAQVLEVISEITNTDIIQDNNQIKITKKHKPA